MTMSGDNCTRVLDQGFVEQGLERMIAGRRPRDPEGVLARATDLLRGARDEAPERDVELFVRRSIRVRVRRERSQETIAAAAGAETGVAARVRSADGRLGFATRVGFDEAAVRSCIASAAVMPGVAGGEVGGWAEPDETTRRDLDETELPSVGRLADWLDSAWAALEDWRARRRRAPVELVDGWLEVASTCEALVTTDGLRAVRARCRGRARARTSRRRPAAEPAALELAARDWRALEPDGWVTLLGDRIGPGVPEQPLNKPADVFVFSPESAASLAQAVVMALSSADQSAMVGPGWCVRDDPGGGDGAFGGRFDDAGHLAEPVELATGRGRHAALPAIGRLRRGSYRDLPAARPWRLVVEPPEVELPARAQLVSACRVLPLDPGRWCLELDVASLEGGAPTVRHPAMLVMTDPASIVERCVGGAGPARELANGVRTPALVFAGLSSSRRR